MKKILFSLFLVFVSISAFSQNSGRGINYQAVLRDSSGTTRASQSVSLRFSLRANGPSGDIHWQETHSLNTNSYGAVSTIIGFGTNTGASIKDSYEDLSFFAHEFWLQVEIEENSSYVEVSNGKLLSAPYAENTTPIGTILTFAGSQIPEGYVECNGDTLNRETYSQLFKSLGTSWGVGNGSTTFNVPDLRGQFLRGVSGGSGVDPNTGARTGKNGGNAGNSVGSYQQDEFKSHTHIQNAHAHTMSAITTQVWPGAGGSITIDANTGGAPTSRTSSYTTATNQNTGGSETRPKNAYVYFIIKVK